MHAPQAPATHAWLLQSRQERQPGTVASGAAPVSGGAPVSTRGPVSSGMLASGITSLGNRDLTVGIQDDLSQTGGGALPTGKLPTKVVAISHRTMSANQIETRLRLGKPAVITRIKEGMVLFDPRTLTDGEIETIVESLKTIFSHG